jgi:hypothetical protein
LGLPLRTMTLQGFLKVQPASPRPAKRDVITRCILHVVMAGTSARSNASLPCPAMTVCLDNRTRHASAFSQHEMPKGCNNRPPNKKEGAGNAGRTMHPQPRVRIGKAHELVTTGSPKRSGIPCTMVLTVSFVLFPVTGLSCHRRSRDRTRRLGISVGMPEPHDFAVRAHAFVRARALHVAHRALASIVSRLTFGDDWPQRPS